MLFERLRGEHGCSKLRARARSEQRAVGEQRAEHVELARPDPLLGRERGKKPRPKFAAQFVGSELVRREWNEVAQRPRDRGPVPRIDERPHARVERTVEVGRRHRRRRRHPLKERDGGVILREQRAEVLVHGGRAGRRRRLGRQRRSGGGKQRHEKCQCREGSHGEFSDGGTHSTLRQAPVPDKGRRRFTRCRDPIVPHLRAAGRDKRVGCAGLAQRDLEPPPRCVSTQREGRALGERRLREVGTRTYLASGLASTLARLVSSIDHFHMSLECSHSFSFCAGVSCSAVTRTRRDLDSSRYM